MNRSLSLPVVLSFLLFTLLVVAGALYYYRIQKEKIISDKEKELQAIVNLKVDEIVQWGNERIADASLFKDNQFLISEIVPYFRNNREDEERELVGYLKSFLENKNYQSILLIDPEFNLRLEYPENNYIMGASLEKYIHNPESKENINISDLHSSDADSSQHLDMVVPLYRAQKNDSLFAGYVVLRIDPEEMLFPLINSWPVPSKSSEIMIFRKEGDSLLFFNNSVFRNAAGQVMVLPDNSSNNLCAKAASGVTGFTEGTDYRNMPVIAYISRLRNSPWSMIGK
ncbi:MAG TPA: hypothetical protein VJ963_06515, partial [Bacteroidales bacterium]|nr:hypothetical protein [Bacteroidales bacterium]